MKKQVFIKVYGLVQGVFFRSWTKNQANLLGLAGYVKNNQDGTVEIVACGEEEKLKKLINLVKKGPKLARVKKLEIKWQEISNKFSEFEIKY